MPPADHPLTELARYRELRRRRDTLIREAARRGFTYGQIARASGLSVARIGQIVAGVSRN